MPATLPEAEWGSVGIARINNIPSHVSFGDLHAQRILSGDYPIERAIDDERRRRALDMAIGLSRYRDAHDDGQPRTTLAMLLARN